jgi:Tfp pilus assembly protein PilX
MRRFLAAERGIALPLALGILLVVAGLAAVASRAAINASHSSFQDSNVKRAIQAANAGVKAAVYQLNHLQPVSNQCVVRAASGSTLSTAAASGQWCPIQSEDLDANSRYSFQVSRSTPLAFNSNGQASTERSIVSTGTVNGVLRRVFVRVSSPGGDPLFPRDHAVVSLSPVDFGNSVHITGHLGSNGDITLRNSVRVDGNAYPGLNKTVTLYQSAMVTGSKTPVTEAYAGAPVNQRGADTVNDNGGIGTIDTWTSPGSIGWDPGTRVLTMSGTSTLTLTGDRYSFCRIELRNSASIRIAARGATQPPLRIYVDTPQNCGGGAGMGSVSLLQSSSFQNLNNSPATFLLAVSGSLTTSTTVDLANAAGPGVLTVMGIYAPYSTVNFSNSINLVGAVLAKQVLASNNITITYDPLILQLVEDPQYLYRRTQYLECTNVATSTSPDSGC